MYRFLRDDGAVGKKVQGDFVISEMAKKGNLGCQGVKMTFFCVKVWRIQIFLLILQRKLEWGAFSTHDEPEMLCRNLRFATTRQPACILGNNKQTKI